MLVNIGNLTDPFYRYKRPISIITNKSGKTTIVNLYEIAKALETNPKYILHYIKLNKSVAITNNNEIKSIISKLDIEKLIDTFINEYILCSKCNLPELIIKKESDKNKKLYFSCKACGNIYFIPENKFTKIIYKNYL